VFEKDLTQEKMNNTQLTSQIHQGESKFSQLKEELTLKESEKHKLEFELKDLNGKFSQVAHQYKVTYMHIYISCFPSFYLYLYI